MYDELLNLDGIIYDFLQELSDAELMALELCLASRLNSKPGKKKNELINLRAYR